MGNPDPSTFVEPRRAVAVVSTLMPRLAAERHHIYRHATALALLAALLAAALGSLSIALVLAAVALPTVVLTYVHDHKLWRDEPITVIAVAFALSLGLGVAVGFLHVYLTPGITLSVGHRLPPVSRILELGVLEPSVAFVAVLVAPLLITAREPFRHPMDVVVISALSGAALSLGLSVIVQHGAFTHLQATAGEPAQVALLALSLGFLQPIVLATAATVASLGIRGFGVKPASGAVRGALLLVLYGLVVTLLEPYGARGIVLTTFAAFVLAAVGLVAARAVLHAALEAAPDVDRLEHRLHGAVVLVIVAVVVIVAAATTAAVVFSGPSTRPKPPRPAPGEVIPTARAVASLRPEPGGGYPLGPLVLASTTTQPVAAGGATISFPDGVSLNVAPGWLVCGTWGVGACVRKSDGSAEMVVGSAPSDFYDVGEESDWMDEEATRNNGLTNVLYAPQDAQAVQGKNFTQAKLVGYTATRQTAQGTEQRSGIWVTLLNPATHIFGFIDLFARSDDALKAALPDAKNMIASMT